MKYLHITGNDAEAFLKRLSTNELPKLGQGIYSGFLKANSEIVSLVYIKKESESEFQIWTKDLELLKTHLEKFIITEDVLIEVDSDANSSIDLDDYNTGDNLIKLSEEQPEKKLLEKYVSFTKGCFPGQEPLAKFKNIGLKKREERSQSYLDEALDIFAKADTKDATQLDPAIDLLRKALKENPRNEDAMESLGVMLAKQGKYQEAIMVMHQLEMINPENQMAQMNLSIFYMKIGDKETAEEHKAKGTVLAFGKALQ